MMLPESLIEYLFRLAAGTLEETRNSLADFSGQTLGIDEECRAQRMIECEDWED